MGNKSIKNDNNAEYILLLWPIKCMATRLTGNGQLLAGLKYDPLELNCCSFGIKLFFPINISRHIYVLINC